MDKPHIDNRVLERMQAGEVALGMVLRLARSGEIVGIAGTSGHDFVFIDTQHALYSLETIGHITQAAIGSGIAALVRVPRFDDPDIAKFLDTGASGIIVADVGNAEQARRVVEATRYPPLGRRSVQSTFSATRYRAYPVKELLAEVERKTLVSCMVETAEGAENLEEIAAVEGIDMIHIGCTDLVADWGKPNAFDAPELRDFVHNAISVCKKHGKFIGLGGDRDLDRIAGYVSKGLNLYTTQTDITFLMQAASRTTSALREKLAALV